jgi:membrane protein
MARLSDIPVVFRTVGVWGLTKRVWGQIQEDNLATWAAALAYSWLFAVFPFLVFLLSLLPYLPEQTKQSTEDQMKAMVYQYVPQDGAEAIWKNVNFVLTQRRATWSVIGLALAIWGASRGINMTISALDKCYELDRGRPIYRQIPVSFLMTVVVALLIICVLVLLPIGTIAVAWIKAHAHDYVSKPFLWGLNILRYPLALILMFSVLNILYHFGPSIKQRFSYITPGAVFAVTVWILLGLGFRIYVEKYAKFNETYGAAGGVVILLTAFYFDALVLLVGAEINSEIDFAVLGVPRGSRDFRTACDVKGACPIDPKKTEEKVEKPSLTEPAPTPDLSKPPPAASDASLETLVPDD